jgi:hypothetical protein
VKRTEGESSRGVKSSRGERNQGVKRTGGEFEPDQAHPKIENITKDNSVPTGNGTNHNNIFTDEPIYCLGCYWIGGEKSIKVEDR